MSSEAQTAANRENAQHSTGPKTEEGKAASAQNNRRHGLAGGIFEVLPWENQDEYKDLLLSLLVQHQPQTAFEEMLVQKIAQHFWLSQRAVRLQDLCFARDVPFADSEENLKLYLRYQAAHDRAFHKLSDELRKLRNETRKQEIGFESQERKRNKNERAQAAEERRQNEEIRRAAAATRSEANEARKTEIHSKRLWLLDGQILHQDMQNHALAASNATLNSPQMRSNAA